MKPLKLIRTKFLNRRVEICIYDKNGDYLIRVYDEPQRKPTHFSRWMNFDNIFLSGIWWFKIKVIYLSNE